MVRAPTSALAEVNLFLHSSRDFNGLANKHRTFPQSDPRTEPRQGEYLAKGPVSACWENRKRFVNHSTSAHAAARSILCTGIIVLDDEPVG